LVKIICEMCAHSRLSATLTAAKLNLHNVLYELFQYIMKHYQLCATTPLKYELCLLYLIHFVFYGNNIYKQATSEQAMLLEILYATLWSTLFLVYQYRILSKIVTNHSNLFSVSFHVSLESYKKSYIPKSSWKEEQ
jgi:hypothetical protein